MARFCKQVLVLLLCIMCYSACQNGEDIGELYGQWQLEKITEDHSEVTLPDYAYWLCFQGPTVSARKTNESNHTFQEVFGNVQHSDDQLSMQFVAINKARNDTLLIENTLRFGKFEDVQLQVERLDNKQLILSKETVCWYFVRW